MKKLSTQLLANAIKEKREYNSITQDELGKKTGINRIMIGKIENEMYIPSVSQLESLSSILGFDLEDIFVESQSDSSFYALKSETISDSELAGVEKLFSMMLALRQQFRIRKSHENEISNSK